jgi:16S rRNA processing protein RimM
MKRSQLPDTPKRHNSTGSPPPGEPVFLVIGRLRRAHGLVGEVLTDVLTDFPERIKIGTQVFLGIQHLPLQIRSVRWHDRALLLGFEGYDDCDQVRPLCNQLIYTLAKELPPLPEGRYYHHELLGLQVRDENGQLLGVLKEIIETGANDVYVVKAEEGPDILLPAIESVILAVDVKKQEMRVHPPVWD